MVIFVLYICYLGFSLINVMLWFWLCICSVNVMLLMLLLIMRMGCVCLVWFVDDMVFGIFFLNDKFFN